MVSKSLIEWVLICPCLCLGCANRGGSRKPHLLGMSVVPMGMAGGGGGLPGRTRGSLGQLRSVQRKSEQLDDDKLTRHLFFVKINDFLAQERAAELVSLAFRKAGGKVPLGDHWSSWWHMSLTQRAVPVCSSQSRFKVGDFPGWKQPPLVGTISPLGFRVLAGSVCLWLKNCFWSDARVFLQCCVACSEAAALIRKPNLDAFIVPRAVVSHVSLKCERRSEPYSSEVK